MTDDDLIGPDLAVHRSAVLREPPESVQRNEWRRKHHRPTLTPDQLLVILSDLESSRDEPISLGDVQRCIERRPEVLAGATVRDLGSIALLSKVLFGSALIDIDYTGQFRVTRAGRQHASRLRETAALLSDESGDPFDEPNS